MLCNEKKRIVCFGDSNTFGYNPITNGRYDEDHRWPYIMQKKLGDRYEVISEGLNGRTTIFKSEEAPYCCGIDYFIPCLLSHCPLDGLIIMLGTNDCSYTESAKNIANGMEMLIEIAKELSIWNDCPHIVIAAPAIIGGGRKIPYADDYTLRWIERSREIIQLYKGLAKKYAVEFFDVNSVASVGPTDLLHLTPEGNIAIGKAFAEKVKLMTKDMTFRKTE